MFKVALVASVAVATEFQIIGAGDFPAITTPMTFVQNAGQENF